MDIILMMSSIGSCTKMQGIHETIKDTLDLGGSI